MTDTPPAPLNLAREAESIEIDERALALARKGKRDIVVRLVAEFCPQVFRTAAVLTGRRDSAEKVTAFLASRAVWAARSWADSDAPQRWFRHHAVLASRRTQQAGSPAEDLLSTAIGGDNPSTEVLAFVAAIRKLPGQQQEALLLHHVEFLNERWLGVAMDCSAAAAGNHLREAERVIRPLSEGQLAPRMKKLRDAVASLAPTGDVSALVAKKAWRRTVWPARLKRAWQILKWAAILFVVFAIGWVLWGWVPGGVKDAINAGWTTARGWVGL
jgi:DNA-directed RNA polymerase specialized sigma24 family protein